MRDYLIKEIFLSIQGEGPSVGKSAVFVRFSGCNLSCRFCDTDHEVGDSYTLQEVINELHVAVGSTDVPKDLLCVFTGGEPLLQLDLDLVQAVKAEGFRTSIETNGSLVAVAGRGEHFFEELYSSLDEVVVSPKGSVPLESLEYATCLKVLWPLPEFLTVLGVAEMSNHLALKRDCAPEYILQPITEVVGSGRAPIGTTSVAGRAYEWFRASGKHWRVIPQTHVLMGLR